MSSDNLHEYKHPDPMVRVHMRIDAHDRELAAQGRDLQLLRQSHVSLESKIDAIDGKIDGIVTAVSHAQGGVAMGRYAINIIFLIIGAGVGIWTALH